MVTQPVWCLHDVSVGVVRQAVLNVWHRREPNPVRLGREVLLATALSLKLAGRIGVADASRARHERATDELRVGFDGLIARWIF